MFYEKNIFNSKESKSGEGSTFEQTKIVREILPKVFYDFGVKTFIDAPCGDFNWMKMVDLSALDHYIGIDIVDKIIEVNKSKLANSQKEFLCLDIVNDNLPAGDLILCRDCLVHLTFEDGLKAIRNFKRSNIKYLLITTFTQRSTNTDLINDDVWRVLNMNSSPFNFPKPLMMINEGCTEADNLFTDKSLGLYLLNDIEI